MYLKLNDIAMIRKISLLLTLVLSVALVSGQEEFIAISKRGPVAAFPGDFINSMKQTC